MARVDQTVELVEFDSEHPEEGVVDEDGQQGEMIPDEGSIPDEENGNGDNDHKSHEMIIKGQSVESVAEAKSPMTSEKINVLAKSGAGILAILGGIWVGRRMCRMIKNKKKNKRRPLSRDELCTVVLALEEPSVPMDPERRHVKSSLDRLELVVSDRMDIVGQKTNHCYSILPKSSSQSSLSRNSAETFGLQGSVCSVSAPIVDMAIEGSATCVGITPSRSTIESDVLDVLEHWTGMGDFGGCAAVRFNLCDFALCVDDIGSGICPAACCGVLGYRSTAGILISEGISQMSATLSSVCIAARDGKTLQRVARSMGVPKVEFKDTIDRYLVAADIFNVCDSAMANSLPAIIRTIKRWASPEQAQSLSLTSWIYHRIFHVLKNFVEEDVAVDTPDPETVLNALGNVAYTIFSEEVGDMEIGHLFKKGNYRDALLVAENLSDACRDAMNEGLVFVLPTLPGIPPFYIPGKDNREIIERYQFRCMQLASLAALTGIPQLTIPVLRKGEPSLAISFLTNPRRDFSLLQAADKIWRLLKVESEADSKPVRQRESTPDTKQEAAKLAEEAKEKGNVQFKASKFEDAVQMYSRAIYLDGNNPIYYSNRAMALMKLGRYDEAEADCTKALEIDPLQVKALLRRGSTKIAMGRMQEGKDDFNRVLQLEPNNKQANDELRKLADII